MHKALRLPFMIIGGIVAAAALALVVGLLVMVLWNWLMDDIFGLPEIGYWQAWGLLLLGHILFGGHDHKFHHERRPRRHDDYRKELKTQLCSQPEPEIT